MSIKIYADENVSAKIIEGLRRLNVDVEYFQFSFFDWKNYKKRIVSIN